MFQELGFIEILWKGAEEIAIATIHSKERM